MADDLTFTIRFEGDDGDDLPAGTGGGSSPPPAPEPGDPVGFVGGGGRLEEIPALPPTSETLAEHLDRLARERAALPPAPPDLGPPVDRTNPDLDEAFGLPPPSAPSAPVPVEVVSTLPDAYPVPPWEAPGSRRVPNRGSTSRKS